jgi:Ca-activated chloride channel family protein
MKIELLPLRQGVKRDEATVIDLLVRIHPQPGPGHQKRPDLNVGLVLDQSTSMTGAKLNQTLQAARKLIDVLLPTDRLSVVLFDDRVQVLIPNTLVTDKPALGSLLGCVKAGGSTALHAGWVQGATQVACHLDTRALNRVLLLTDGQPNVGEIDPDKICSDVNGLLQRGVSTTTLGFGADYNEVLLRSMAASGGGNHHFVQHPSQLGELFDLEVGALVSTLGKEVKLNVESPGEVEVLTRIERDPDGKIRLGDLVEYNPVTVLLRTTVPAGRAPQASVTLEYFALDEQKRKTITVSLYLRSMDLAEWDSLVADSEVLQEVALWESAEYRRQVVAPLFQGDLATVNRLLNKALDRLRALPDTALVARHLQEIEEIIADVADNDTAVARKRAVQQELAYSRSSVSRSSDPRMRLMKRLMSP